MQMPGPTQFSNPPPMIPNLNVPPPSVSVPPPGPPPPTGSSSIQVPLGPPPSYGHQHHYGGGRGGGGHRHFFQPFRPYMRPGPGPPGQAGLDEFDGKRLRKSVMRKTVDYNSSIIKALECRVWQRDARDKRALQPDVTYYPNMEPPPSYVENPINSVVTRFVKTATNKMRCPIFCMAWTPEGRRLVTGASSGEFTLWNGLTFNFETILQAHDSPVRTMVWSHNDTWMVTGDHMGYVKYWQSNMNNVKMFQAHKEAIRGLSFSPTDQKFVTCSDDGTLRIWDFARCHEERILRGHGADVKCVHWHPQKSLIISGSKDNQQPIKLWDPKTGTSLATLHAHKSTVMDIKWNENGNWLVTASRDHLLKLFDIRNLSTEVQTFRGHKKEASSVAWHPHHEGLFCSGGSDGAILFWHVGADKEVGAIEQAHDSIVWTLAWHPLGHILCSGSNDHTSKFWTRNRPGDAMRDKYNLNTLPAGLAGMDDQDIDDNGVIPGMGPEDKVEENVTVATPAVPAVIPGLDFEGVEDRNKHYHKKVPYSKPIPRNFVAQWNETGEHDADSSSDDENGLKPVLNPIAQALRAVIENTTIPGCIPLNELQPQAIIMYGKILPVEGDNVLSSAIAAGGDTLQRLVASGQIEEFQDVMPHLDDDNFSDYSNEDCMDIEGTLDNLQMPAPLPSSIFAKKGGPVAQRKTRFSDPDPVQQVLVPHNLPPSLTSQGPQLDPKAQEDEDLRILRDIDMRLEMMNNVANLSAPAIAMGGPPIGPGGGPPFGGPPPSVPSSWGATAWADGLRPGLNNFGTRNFVSSGNFDDPPFSAGANGGASFAPNDPRANAFNANDGFDNGNQFGGSWGGPNMGGPRNQMGPRQMGPQMGHNGPMGSNRPSMQGNMGPGMGPGRHTMMPGGPQMGMRHPMGPNMGPGGPNMGPSGPNMGPGGPNLGQSGPNMGGGMNMGPGGPNMGPGGPNMGPNMGPGGPNMGPGGPNMGPGGPNMGLGGPNMGPGGPNMGPGGSNMGPGGPNMGPGGPNMGPGGPNMGPGGPNMGPGGPNMGPGGPNMGPSGPNMGPGGPNMGPGGPNMGGMGPGMQMGPNFQNQNTFYRGGGRGFSRGRGNFDNSRGGGFDGGMGGFNSNRGGFEGKRGGFEGGRGGGFEGKRGGGFDGGRGGFDSNRGGFDGGRSGFDGKRGGFEGNRGGFNNGNRSFDKDQGGFESKRGGFEGNRGDYDGGRGKDRGGNDGRDSSGSGSRASRFSGSSRGNKSRGYTSNRDKDNN